MPFAQVDRLARRYLATDGNWCVNQPGMDRRALTQQIIGRYPRAARERILALCSHAHIGGQSN